VLDNDASTVRESGIFDQCVVHCLVVSRPSTTGSGNSNSGSGATSSSSSGQRNGHGGRRPHTIEPGMFFIGFIGVFLIFLWFICFHFGQHLFTQSAVVSLTVLTGLFLIGLVAFYLPVHPPNAAQWNINEMNETVTITAILRLKNQIKNWKSRRFPSRT